MNCLHGSCQYMLMSYRCSFCDCIVDSVHSVMPYRCSSCDQCTLVHVSTHYYTLVHISTHQYKSVHISIAIGKVKVIVMSLLTLITH